MNKGVLSVKIMILGGVLFLAGCEFAYDNSQPALAALMAGPVLMLVGLLMGNRDRKGAE